MGLLVKRRVTLDLARRGTQATVPFSLGDRCAYEVIFTLRDGSEQVALPPGTSAAVTVRNGAGGTGCVDGCVIDHVNNNVIYTPTVDALSVEGNIECTLHLFDGDGGVIGAPTFIFAVSEGDKADTEGEVSKALVANPGWGIIADTENKAKEAAEAAALAGNFAGQAGEEVVAAGVAAGEARAEADRARTEAELSKMWANGGILVDEPPSEVNNSYYWAMMSATERISAETQVELAVAEVNKAKTEVQNAAAEVEKAKAEVQTAEAEAIKARMWAVGETVKSGKRNPTDTNNAMYYSDKSKEYMNEAEKYTNMTLSLSVDREKHIYTVSLIRDGTVIGNPIEIDLPFEEVVVGGEYDDTTEALVLKLKDGGSVRIPVGDIISPDDVVRRQYPGSYDAVYTETSSGEVVLLPVKVYSGDGAANTLVKRGSLGEIRVRSTPEFDDEAVPKRHVDEVADALGKGLEDLKEWVTQNQPAPVEIVQNLGDSPTAVIAQKGVTNAIDGLALKGTASGKVIRVDDVAPGEYPVKVKVRGKNLFHFARDFTGTANGITATALTGHSEIVANGTVTEAQAFAMDASATVLPAGTYTISIYGANDVAASYDRVYIENEDGIIANYIKTGAPKTFTLSKTSTVKICIIFGVGSTYDSATIGVQIELGDTATDYEPYVDPSSVKVTRYGATTSDSSQTYTPTADGTVDGVMSLYPVMHLVTDNTAAILDVEYSRDINSITDVFQGAFDTVIVSDNKFDNTFNEAGYIDINTGEELDGQYYKRTGFYDLEESDNSIYYIHNATANPVIVFYDAEKNFVSYGIVVNNAVRENTNGDSIRFFRIYAGDTFSGDIYVSRVQPNAESVDYSYKTSPQLKSENAPKDDELTDIRTGYDGTVYETAGEAVREQVKSIDKKGISASWKFAGSFDDLVGTNSVVSIRATTLENAPIADTGTLFTYTADNGSGVHMCSQLYMAYNKHRMYYRIYSNGYWIPWQPTAQVDKVDAIYIANTKDLNDYNTDASVYGIAEQGVANAPENDVGYVDIQHYKSGRLATTNDTVQRWHGKMSGNDYVRIYDGYSGTWHSWVKVNGGGSIFAGKTFVFIGDSIYGNNDTATGIVSKFASKTGATCYNFAFGGTRAKARNDGTDWVYLDGENLATAIATGDYTEQIAALDTIETSMIDTFAERLTAMQGLDWTTVDYIICDWGTNDWYGTTPEAYKSAMKNIIATILTAYPNISFVKCTPIQRFIQDDEGAWVSGIERQDPTTSAKLLDFVEVDKEIGAEESIKVVDCFNIGINKYTRTYYFTEPDCTHPNEKGNELLVCHMVSSL